MSPQTLTEKDWVLLDEVEADTVSFQHRGTRGTTYKLWITGHEYVTCTPAAKKLVAAGLVKEVHGYRHGRGGVELTPLGKKALEAHRAGLQGVSGHVEAHSVACVAAMTAPNASAGCRCSDRLLTVDPADGAEVHSEHGGAA